MVPKKQFVKVRFVFGILLGNGVTVPDLPSHLGGLQGYQTPEKVLLPQPFRAIPEPPQRLPPRCLAPDASLRRPPPRCLLLDSPFHNMPPSILLPQLPIPRILPRCLLRHVSSQMPSLQVPPLTLTFPPWVLTSERVRANRWHFLCLMNNIFATN